MKSENKDKNKESVNYNTLNGALKEYRLLGHSLNILTLIAIIAVLIYLLNKLHIIGIIVEFLELLIPLFVGVVLAWLFTPIIDKLSKNMPRILSCIIVYLGVIGLFILMLYIIIPSFATQIKDLFNSVPVILEDLRNFVSRFVGKNSDIENGIFKAISNFSDSYASDLPDKLIVGTKSFISVMATAILGIMISFYISNDYHKFTKKFYSVLPKRYRDDAKDLISRINSSLRDYVQGVFFVMLLVFISQSIGLTLSGLKAPLIFALICAITDIIPYFGPWIGAIPALVVAITISPLTFIFTAISIIVVQLLENNFYQPLIMGHAMKLHPVTIMLGLLIFGHFFGIAGMILATPIVATLKIIFFFLDEKIHFIDKIDEMLIIH